MKEWIPDSIYITVVSVIVPLYSNCRKELKSLVDFLPENMQFDVDYNKVKVGETSIRFYRPAVFGLLTPNIPFWG